MNEIIGWIAISCGLFIASLALGWLVARRKQKSVLPVAGTKIRIRAAGAIYRSRLLRISDEGWWIDAPLQRDFHFPLHVGEAITVEAPVTDGVVLARTLVSRRNAANHEILLETPSETPVVDRRQFARLKDCTEAAVDGMRAVLADLSSGGARFVEGPRLQRGSRVKLELPGFGEPAYGWVLESGSHTRIRFEELVSLAPHVR